MCQAAVALIVVLLAQSADPAAATATSTFVLDNGTARATFVGEPGREHELASVELPADRRAISFLTSKEQPRCSSGWSVLLRDRQAPFAAGKYVWITAGDPRLTIARKNAPSVGGLATETTFEFVADHVEFDGAEFRMTVAAHWRLPPGGAFLEGDFSLSIPGLARLPFYVSQVVAPTLLVRPFDESSHRCQVVVPSQGGVLIENPLGSSRFPRAFGGRRDDKPWVVPWVQIPLLAYYDETTRDCLCFSDDDVTGCFRDYEVLRHDDAREGGRYLELRTRHLPENVYASESWTMPFHTRIAAMAGDWIDVAQQYRRFLADPANHATFYKGPIGARTDVASEMKNLVLHAYVTSSAPGDNLDSFGRDAIDVNRLAGGTGNLEIWPAGFFPDQFEQFYFEGWLPGRPSLVAAVREAQDRAGAIVAPYVNSCAGVDHVAAGESNPTALMRTIHDGAMVMETGQPFRGTLATLPANGECNADWGWSRVFVDNVVDVVRFTGARAIYLDAFTTSPCFAHNGSADGHAGHAAGGGNYMVAGRLAQLRAIRRALAESATPFLGFVTEGNSLWYAGDVDVMHLRPTELSVTDGVDEKGNPLLIENAKSIPFFRMVVDSVKISQFENDVAPTLGQRAWLAALDVFAFGMVPHVANNHVDLAPTYGEESLRADAPFQRYFRRVVGCLRSGFLRYHDGTLERAPRVRVDHADFQGPVGADRSNPQKPHNDPWQTDPVIRAMCRGALPSDGVAFVATNPWVGTPSGPTFRLETTVRPHDYGVDRAHHGFTVTLYDEDSRVLESSRHVGDEFAIDVPLAPGAIRYWTFTD